jgi:hypothetical protein
MASDKVQLLLATLAGFAVGCGLVLAVGGQLPFAAGRPSFPTNLAGLPYQQPTLATQSKFLQPMQPIRARASRVVANAESETEMGRRQMMAGAFGLAFVASNRATIAAEDTEFDRTFGRAYVEPELEKAEDFTRYDKVVTKKLPSSKAAKEVTKAPPGSVEPQPLLVPGVVAFSAFAAAAVPALLSPGQTAKDAQDAQRSAIKRKVKEAPKKKVKGAVKEAPKKKNLFR